MQRSKKPNKKTPQNNTYCATQSLCKAMKNTSHRCQAHFETKLCTKKTKSPVSSSYHFQPTYSNMQVLEMTTGARIPANNYGIGSHLRLDDTPYQPITRQTPGILQLPVDHPMPNMHPLPVKQPVTYHHGRLYQNLLFSAS